MDASHAEPLLREERTGGVLRLLLNRPGARNALSTALMAALQERLDALAQDGALRVIVLASSGPAFCSGHDLKEMNASRREADAGRSAFAKIFAQCSRLMQTIARHPKPVIAEVQGIATAAGAAIWR
jgi:enoyl-CoA hydratase/carnithine racemase